MDIKPVNEPGDFEPILAQLGANGGAIFNADAFINNNIKGSAAKSGMITYNLDILAQFRQTAPYLDRILKGEKPADLPVQQPTKFQYVINLKAAKALDLAVPLTMQMTADEVIE